MREKFRLRFEADDRSICVDINSRCIAHWAQYRQTRIWHKERGGLLFAPTVGSRTGSVEIVNASGPHAADQAGRRWLKLDHTQCMIDINDRFEEGLHFVGYWHTHPEPRPILSNMDRRSLTRVLKLGGVDLTRIIAFVVGNDKTEVFCSAYLVNSESEEALFQKDKSRIDLMMGPRRRN